MKNLRKRLACLLLSALLLIGCLPVTALAAENGFILVVEAGGKLVIAPEYISCTAGQTAAQALSASGHTFTGLDTGMISAIDGVTGNFTRSDENGNYDLSVSAASIGYLRFSEDMDVEVTYNDDTGDIEVYQFKIVVEDDDVANEDTQIALADAREHDPSVQLDDEMGFRVKVEDLGRIAAQSAKQVIIQRMRDAEQELIYEEFKDRVGEICSGIIQRRDKGGWIINLGRTEAILPKEEQIPREHYKRGDRVQALIIEVKKEGRGPQIVISRSHRDYTAALFRRGSAGSRRRHRADHGRRPRSGQPRQSRRALP